MYVFMCICVYVYMYIMRISIGVYLYVYVVCKVRAFNLKCCCEAPVVLFSKVATSTPSGKGCPDCRSYLDLIVPQTLKSCSKVAGLNLKSRSYVKSDVFRVAPGSENFL